MKRINIAELLKNCPSGMELNCVMFENVEFHCVTNNEKYPIEIIIKDDIGGDVKINLTKEGYFNTFCNPKCIIFPKGKMTWEGFVPPVVFKDGDIVSAFISSIGGTWIGVFKQYENGGTFETYCSLSTIGEFINTNSKRHLVIGTNLATEEEKQRLFKAIEDNGYKWNAETKILEKLVQPKFKVGDIIKNTSYKIKITKVNIENEYYECGVCSIRFDEQDDWKLVPDKFDLSTLKPYKSEVLYRNTLGGYWKPAFWGAYIPENSEQHSNHNFLTTDGFTRYCIPFEGNEHLMGKQDDCSEYYKTWKE